MEENSSSRNTGRDQCGSRDGINHGATAALARACTCHPDDNPPTPCAQRYALNNCRKAAEIADLVRRSREHAEGLHQLAWSRLDGGSELTRAAMTIEELCDAFEDTSPTTPA